MSASDDIKDFIDGWVGGKRTVYDCELSLQTLWNVISTSSRLNHSGHELQLTD